MAQRVVTPTLSTNRPGAYPDIVVQDNPVGIGDTGIVAILGEADGGIDFANDDLKLNYYGGDQVDKVTEKYIRGPVVDAMRMLASASNDTAITGAPSRVYILKTNAGTKASVTLTDFFGNAMGTLRDKNYGIDGNKYFYDITESVSEITPIVYSSDVTPLSDAKEKTEIEFSDAIIANYSGMYFQFYAANDTKGYYVYYDDTGAVADPALTGLFNGNGIRVDISNATSIAAIALATANAIQQSADDDVTASISGDNNKVLIIENVNGGKTTSIPDATNTLTNVTFDVIIPGSDTAQEESSEIHFNAAEVGGNYESKYFTVFSARDAKEWVVWYTADSAGGGTAPTVGTTNLIKVEIDDNASASSIASATQSTIAAHPEASDDFNVSIKATNANVLIITNKLPGATTSVTNADGTDDANGIPNALDVNEVNNDGANDFVAEIEFNIPENNQGNYHDKYFIIYDQAGTAYNIYYNDGILASTAPGGNAIEVVIERGDSVNEIVSKTVVAINADAGLTSATIGITASIASTVNTNVIKITQNSVTPQIFPTMPINFDLPVFKIAKEGLDPDADLLNEASFQFRINGEDNVSTITLSNNEEDHDTIARLVDEINALLVVEERSDVIAKVVSDSEDNNKFSLSYVEGIEVIPTAAADDPTAGDSLEQKYFLLEDTHYVWFDLNGATLDPEPTDPNDNTLPIAEKSIKVTIDGTETKAEMAEKIAEAINNEGSYSIITNAQYMRVYDETYKRSATVTNGDTEFTIGTKNSPAGIGKSLEIFGEPEELAVLGIEADVYGSVREREIQLAISRQDIALSEVFDVGGDIALTIGYHGSRSGVNLTITDTTLLIEDGSGDDLININLGEFATVGDVALHINSQTSFTAKAIATSKQQPPTVLDNVSLVGLHSEDGKMGCRVKKDAYLWERKIGESSVVEFEWDDNANKTMLPLVSATAMGLTGGTRGATTAADIIAAIDALEGLDVNFVVPLFSRDAISTSMGYGDIEAGLTDSGSTYTIDAINLALKNHVLKMSTNKIKRHRQGFVSYWYGEKGDFSAAQEAAGDLAHARMSLAFQKVSQVNSSGNIQLFMPWMASVAAAGMQAAGFYKAIVNKFVNVLSFTDPAGFDSGSPSEVENAIDSGVMIIEKALVGNRWIIDQTTYGIDANFVYNSIQAVYAADIVALDLARSFHNAFVGESLADINAKTGISFLASRMDTYARLKLIAGSDDAPLGYKNAKIRLEGPIMYVSVEIKLATAILFIPITIMVSAISQSASGE